MLRLGLTGGIGAGKSTVSKTLVELGGVLVDADVIAREVVEPGTAGLAQLVDAFGEDVLDSSGALDRPALAAKAFGDNDSRAKLNSIVHPLIGARTAELIDGAPDDAVVIQDIPLLVEGNMGAMFQLVAVVHADAEQRLDRLVNQRNMPEHDARARIAAQATDDARRAAADIWIDNSGAPEDLDEVVRSLWFARLVPFEKNIRHAHAVDTPAALVPADAAWPAQAQRIIARLAVACGNAAVRIDHIGSTAVPGLPAKDVIDIQITVAGMDAADALAESLRRIGFPRLEKVVSALAAKRIRLCGPRGFMVQRIQDGPRTFTSESTVGRGRDLRSSFAIGSVPTPTPQRSTSRSRSRRLLLPNAKSVTTTVSWRTPM